MTTITRRRRTLPALPLLATPLLLTPLLLTACAATPAADPGGAAHASAVAVASAIASAEGSAAATPSGPIMTGAELCALVPVAKAAATLATSPAITRSEGGSFAHGEPICSYASDDTKLVITVLYGDRAHDAFSGTKPILGSGAMTAVPGVGRAAAANAAETDVDLGAHTLAVESVGGTDATRAQVVSLATLFAERL